MNKNPAIMDKIEENFSIFINRDFNRSKPEIIRGISDHNVDKVALVSFPFEKIREQFRNVVYSNEAIEFVKGDLNYGFNVIFAGSHFSGIEWYQLWNKICLIAASGGV